ncbi:MAG: hypothetical protein WC426_14140 [Sulfuriferula sp.]
MEPDKNTPPADAGQKPAEEPQAPADALSRTPDDLENEKAEQKAANPEANKTEEPGAKKASPIKEFFHKINLYFLIFVLLVVIAAVVAAVNYLNSTKAPVEPNIATQSLSQDALKQLANTDATVGDASKTLTIQGNAIITGQTLMRGNLNVAGNFQTGGSITAPNITISGTSNLGTAQINNLQVATNTAIQGSTTLRDLNVAGTSSFSGAMTASQITVTKLILSGSGTLQLPNHLSFSGPSPGRSFIGSGILGSGGSVSLNGSDTSGTINMNTGNSPNGSGCIVRINFQQTFSSQPRVIISPVGSAAGSMDYYVDRNTTGFSLCTNTTPAANKVFAFDYFVAG